MSNSSNNKRGPIKWEVKKIRSMDLAFKDAVLHNKNKSPINYVIVDSNKDFASISKHFNDGLIYNKLTEKIYSLNDNKKTVIGINKTGEPLTDDNFGKKMKPLNVEYILSDATKTKDTSKTRLLNNLVTQKINGVDFTNLVKRVESLESIVSSLTGSGGSSKNSNKDTDAITGLKTRVSSLEDAVKLDPVEPSSNKDAGINYYLNRNHSHIKSNYEEMLDNYTLILQMQSNITSDYTTDLVGLDLLGMINSLTERVEALEG